MKSQVLGSLERSTVETVGGPAPILVLTREAIDRAVATLQATDPEATAADLAGVALSALDDAREGHGVHHAVLLVEQADGSVRASVRSDELLREHDAIALAEALGSGGGKPGSAAATLDGPLDAARAHVTTVLQAHAERIVNRDPFRGGVHASPS